MRWLANRAAWLHLAMGLILAIVLSGCSSIHIQTGPQTNAEAAQSSADRGSQFRSEWMNRLGRANVIDQGAMLATFIDSTSARYIRYGYRVADTWRSESDRVGVDVPVEEIRRMLDRTLETEGPLLEAYEDVLEYGINQISEARYFDSRTEELLAAHRDQFLEVYSAVFYPNGNWEDFESTLQRMQQRIEDTSRDLKDQLRQYQ